MILACVFAGGFGVASLASSAPPGGLCDRKPNHPKCATTSGTTTAPTTTTSPPPTSGDVANLWVEP